MAGAHRRFDLSFQDVARSPGRERVWSNVFTRKPEILPHNRQTDQRSAAEMRVSVVVPVFRPGPSFDDLIASLDRQTMDAASFEVLLCDDGSGEPTGARLADVARNRPNVRVLSLEHSGWPGMPRNHGIDAARGTYVQFVDQDDYLFDGALEKLCDYADLHGSDVVVGKEVGIGRRLPSRIFSRDIPRAQLATDPLLEMLTPHKMFRTSFLRANGIRFPEGKVRLEDHLFVMHAYFAASTISILASEPCYAWVKQKGSASSSRIEPETYFVHLESVLDLVEAHTEPGELRDQLLRHWFRGKVLKRVSGRQMLRYPADYRERLLDALVPLARRRFGSAMDAALDPPHRLRATLLRADRRDDLLGLARVEAETTCRAEVTCAAWSRGGGLHLTVRITVLREGDSALPDELSVVADHDRRDDRVDLVLDDSSGGGRRIARRRTGDLAAVRLSVDPLKIFDRADPSRGGVLGVRVRHAGWSFEAPLEASPAILAGADRSPLLAGRTCTLAVVDPGVVRLRREWPTGRAKDVAGRTARRMRALISR